MHFNLASVVSAIVVSTAVAATLHEAPRSLITGVWNALAGLQEVLGVIAVEAKLDDLLGNSLT
ncbi:hypothetical protein B0I35DRAFT_484992 [Stachybotrys elegans]|uniref:Uncharacterized protein n=1 Tax=Stachybotrys elegans TaxID=80388 RepID=A0A8K0WKQ2_9HYPO|nr:hypothetical protein B0I35DRAFT_484992 [Stachybotrys elegans]